jgi:hypothetical protein
MSARSRVFIGKNDNFTQELIMQKPNTSKANSGYLGIIDSYGGVLS